MPIRDVIFALALGAVAVLASLGAPTAGLDESCKHTTPLDCPPSQPLERTP